MTLLNMYLISLPFVFTVALLYMFASDADVGFGLVDGARDNIAEASFVGVITALAWPAVVLVIPYSFIMAVRWIAIELAGAPTKDKYDEEKLGSWPYLRPWPPPPPSLPDISSLTPGVVVRHPETGECIRNHAAAAGYRPRRESWEPAPLPPINFTSSVRMPTQQKAVRPFRSKIKTTKSR